MNYITTQRMRKRAGFVQDYIGGTLSGELAGVLTGGIGRLANTAGTIHGIASKAPSERELNEMNDNPGMSWIPGVGYSRLIRKRTGLSKKYGQGKTNMTSETFGPYTAFLASAGVGGALGAGIGAVASRVNGSRVDDGAVMGLGIGAASGAGLALLANLVATGAAAVTSTRTDAEQGAYERSNPTAANFLVPGVGVYNAWKSTGRILADEKEYQTIKDLKRMQTILKEQQEARKS